MQEFIKNVQAFLDSMTQEEFDQMLIEMGNENGTPGPMFKTREDFKKKASKSLFKNTFHLKIETKKEVSSITIKVTKDNKDRQNFMGFEINNNAQLCEMVS
ncbi:hypothetical protein [Methanimicrococcus blatticola]|uniref:Uncharacterized protein n=1 Tax=Methanimicrococcus blatticola TaxID=91560 RepID=A0A484F5S5_9EURY|nr:hypothetical protein [Methanimicrococcus blatticola]MBZ3935871.1 hypothetical protein [Methanimicrococcus blatticola]MCC2508008.1 hypothetical protein [Methanimicrococcus blatticola]TDQ68909.1 hypothetical protein C7391_1109 [Methanimicrococcus blatticola]